MYGRVGGCLFAFVRRYILPRKRCIFCLCPITVPTECSMDKDIFYGLTWLHFEFMSFLIWRHPLV